MVFITAIGVAYLIGILPLEYGCRYNRYRVPIWLILAEFTKGVCAVLFAWLYAGSFVAYFCAVVVVIAHMYPFYSRFSRSGLTVTTGALFVLSPILLLIATGIFLLSLLAFRKPSLSLILAITAFIIFAIVLTTSFAVWFLFFVLGLFLCTRPLIKGWKC